MLPLDRGNFLRQEVDLLLQRAHPLFQKAVLKPVNLELGHGSLPLTA